MRAHIIEYRKLSLMAPPEEIARLKETVDAVVLSQPEGAQTDEARLKKAVDTIVRTPSKPAQPALAAPEYEAINAWTSNKEAQARLHAEIAQELGIAEKLFWATKVNVASRVGGADGAAARRQIEASFARIGRKKIDLIQVHNMGDIATQLPILREFKQQGRVRYLGITTTFESQYAEMIETMRAQQLDFIGTNYAIDDRFAEKTILPLARDKGIAVLCYAPFGRSRLWARVKDRPLPAWASEIDARTWAQFFLKFVASHPDITCITPATSRATNMADNMDGGRGRLPDAAMRKRMIEFIDGLPGA